MLARAFKIDVTQCEQCGGRMRAVSYIMERLSIIRYLKAARIDYEISARGPPKYTDVSLDFEINQLNAFDEPTIYLDKWENKYLAPKNSSSVLKSKNSVSKD